MARGRVVVAVVYVNGRGRERERGVCVIGGVRCAVTMLWVLEEEPIIPDVTLQITMNGCHECFKIRRGAKR